MPRNRRVDFANAVQHVMNRGLEHRDIVRNDDDRNIWWDLFERVATRCQWRVFAVVLLDNHFHIYLRTPLPNLSAGMHDLDGGYASVFNGRHKRIGPLYQGRFKSVLVEREAHSWELSRYVHLNPVRAGLTDNPARYRWSSYRFYLSPRDAPEWLDWRTVLAEHAGSEGAARIGYKRFVESGMKQKLSNPFAVRDTSPAEPGPTLGSPNTPLPKPPEPTSIDEIVVVVAAEFDVPVELLRQRGRVKNFARDAAVLIAREWSGHSADDVAAVFGIRTRSSVSEIVRRAREREVAEPSFREQLSRIRQQLTR